MAKLGFLIAAAVFLAAKPAVALPLSGPVLTHLARACVRVLSGKPLNPYYLGQGFHPITQVEGLEIRFPELPSFPMDDFNAVAAELIRKEAKLREVSAIMRAGQYVALRDGIADTMAPLHNLYQVAPSGAFFQAFVEHPLHPDHPYPMMRQSQQEYLNWIRRNGTNIVKALNLDEMRMREHIDYFRKSWQALAYLAHIAPGVTFQGRPLVEVAQMQWTDATGETGAFEQAYAYGPTTAQLQTALVSRRVMTVEGVWVESGEFLAIWGLSRGDAERLQPELAALEELYLRLHKWGFDLPKLDFLWRGNTTNFRQSSVLFDFNHGQNIIYDVLKRRFVIIDG
jgi:hypothetical protein